MTILFDSTSQTPYVGNANQRKATIYMGPEDVTRLSIFYDKRFPAATTITSTWEVLGDSSFTVGTSSASGLGVQTFCTAPSSAAEATIRNTVVGNNGETASATFKVICVE